MPGSGVQLKPTNHTIERTHMAETLETSETNQIQPEQAAEAEALSLAAAAGVQLPDMQRVGLKYGWIAAREMVRRLIITPTPA